jgi:hypothetical protein
MVEEERKQKGNKSIVACDTVSKLVSLKAAVASDRHGQQPRNFGPFDKVHT